MKSLLKDFRDFINRGSVMDMAVGVVIGSAFTAIINSVVNDLLMPLISLLTGGVDFSEWKVVLGEGEDAATLNYGNLIAAVIDFLLIALVIFLIVRAFNRMREKNKAPEAPAAPTTKICPFCRSEIPIGAVRCPHCTSELSGESAE